LSHPAENFAVEKVIMKYKRRVGFQEYTQKKRITTWISCLSFVIERDIYMTNMTWVCCQKCHPTHGMGVLKLIIEMEGVGYKSFMDNYFSSSHLLFRSTEQENKQLWYC
jgi:hypothetical protein